MRIVLVLLVVLAFAMVQAEAAQPHMTKEQLRAYATHIVLGKVGMIYERPRQHGHYKYVRYLAEVTVEKVEKGEGLAKGELIYVRYWTRDWTGPGYPPPGGGGQTSLMPKEGAALRIYLARGKKEGLDPATDKGLEVVNPNGFERP